MLGIIFQMRGRVRNSKLSKFTGDFFISEILVGSALHIRKF